MANVWSECTAKSRGERELAAHLATIDDPKLHLFFSLGFIPGGREIDLLLIHEDIGAFILEVKSSTLQNLTSVCPNEWVMTDRDSRESPIHQAYAQYEGLRDFISPHYSNLPFVGISACLPKITRRNWKEAFNGSLYAANIADSLFFEEDLFSGNLAFLDRLRYVHMHPPARQGRSPRGVKPDFLRLLREFVHPVRPLAPTQSEQEKLRAIERGITSEVQLDFPPDAARHAVFSGRPGTGKTFRLLSIGAFHAFSKKRVLFVCFNKTLAADTRRLLSFSAKLQLSGHPIEVLDINQLALRCFEMNGMGFFDSHDADQWGQYLIEQLDATNDPVVQKFDTILVDEAQDMKGWQLDLLERHASNNSSVALALGQGQELYRDAASATTWLEVFEGREHIKRTTLRGNFRNPREQYYFAEAFHEAWPTKFENLEVCRKRVFATRKQEVVFARESGEAPKYVSVPVDPREYDDHGRDQDEIFADTLLPILEHERAELVGAAGLDLVGLLVLVPNQDGLHARSVRLALERLCAAAEGGFIDYTREESRRASALRHEVRLCTFHSARGLEAERVVVLGLEAIEHVANAAGAKPENLAFIALSRGLFATTIVVRASPRTLVHNLCERILQCLRSPSVASAAAVNAVAD